MANPLNPKTWQDLNRQNLVSNDFMDRYNLGDAQDMADADQETADAEAMGDQEVANEADQLQAQLPPQAPQPAQMAQPTPAPVQEQPVAEPTPSEEELDQQASKEEEQSPHLEAAKEHAEKAATDVVKAKVDADKAVAMDKIQKDAIQASQNHDAERAAKQQSAIQNLQSQADQKVASDEQKLDEEWVPKTFGEVMQSGKPSEKLSTAFGVLLGGVSQGLLHLGSNPVLDYMNKQVELYAHRRKLDNDAKKLLQQQMYQQASLQLKQDALKQSSVLKAQNYEKNSLEMAALADKIKKERGEKAALDIAAQGKPLQSEQKRALDVSGHGENLMSINGKDYYVSSKDAKKKLEDRVNKTDDLLRDLDHYDNLLKTMSPVDKLNFLSKNHAEAEALQSKLIGALREPLEGPGILTKSKREDIKKILGNFDFFNLSSNQRAKLNILVKDLKTSVNNQAKNAGVNDEVYPEPKYSLGGKVMKESDLVKNLQKKYPNMSEENILDSLKKINSSSGQ